MSPGHKAATPDVLTELAVDRHIGQPRWRPSQRTSQPGGPAEGTGSPGEQHRHGPEVEARPVGSQGSIQQHSGTANLVSSKSSY